jgi:hypothetical protein
VLEPALEFALELGLEIDGYMHQPVDVTNVGGQSAFAPLPPPS